MKARFDPKTAARILALIGHSGFLAYMSLATAYPAPVKQFLVSTGARPLHAGGYFVLAVLSSALAKGNVYRGAALGTAWAFLYGLLLEVAQLGVPGRTLQGLDIGVNLGGALLGSAAFLARGVWVSRVRANRGAPPHPRKG